MKIVLLCMIVFSILCLGIKDILKTKNTVKALEEIVDFILLFKNELNLKNSDYYDFYNLAIKENFKFITFSNNEITLNNANLELNLKDFKDFTSNMGKSDIRGQIELCDNYLNKFNALLNDKKTKEKSKMQVSASLTALSLVCVIVLFF